MSLINIIITNISSKQGSDERIRDFISFLDEYKIEYDVSYEPKKNRLNYIYTLKNKDLVKSNFKYIIHISNMRQFAQCFYLLDNQNIKFVIHNFYFYKQIRKYINNIYFIPQFIFVKNMPAISKQIKFKYGLNFRDSDTQVIRRLLNCNRLNDILLLSESMLFKNNITTDKFNFFSSVKYILYFYDYYNIRHVTSRFKLEAAFYNLKFVVKNIFNHDKIHLNTFKQFSSKFIKQKRIKDNWFLIDVNRDVLNMCNYKNFIIAQIKSNFNIDTNKYNYADELLYY